MLHSNRIVLVAVVVITLIVIAVIAVNVIIVVVGMHPAGHHHRAVASSYGLIVSGHVKKSLVRNGRECLRTGEAVKGN